MAGMPIRRARKQLEQYHRDVMLRDGAEPMQFNDLDYQDTVPAPPVRHIAVPQEERAPPRPIERPLGPDAMPAPSPPSTRPSMTPALDPADAELFGEARKIAMQKALAFLRRDLSLEMMDATVRAKLELKQLEMAQGMLALGGRIDPGSMKTVATDELGDLLASIKASS